jgi:DNA-directed RNA polymerase specialized sigma24 family protein
MNDEYDRPKIIPVPAGEAKQHASTEEVENALHALTLEEHAKLMIIAKSFCRSRHLSISVMEPKELLSEAVAKTLRMDRKWNKRVSLVKHLDRAMESISGHLVTERSKIDYFPEGLEPSNEQRGPVPTAEGVDEALMRKEEVEALLEQVFGDDTEAAQIFERRLDGFQAAEIQSKLKFSQTKYDAVAKRIRRKIALHLNKK